MIDNINGSIIAGGNVEESVNANNSNVINKQKILRDVKKTSFWISFLTGIVSSMIASCVFEYIIK